MSYIAFTILMIIVLIGLHPSLDTMGCAHLCIIRFHSIIIIIIIIIIIKRHLIGSSDSKGFRSEFIP